MTFGSLFSGIGGFDLGLERSGMCCKWQVEINDYANKVLEKHWPNIPRWRDIKKFPPKRDCILFWENKVDLICGGFPCQPVSVAGKRKGTDDERWLWEEMCRVCSVLRPRWVLAENVPGLLSAGDVRGELFGKVLRDLAEIGYDVEWHCIPAAAFGAPHIRDRVFILAHSNSDSKSSIAIDEKSRQGELVSDSDKQRCYNSPERHTAFPIIRCDDTAREDIGASWCATEPDVGRVANGVPHRVDRLRCLGNAVVPQVIEWIGERIIALEPKMW